jgi:hypothetical protein
LYRGTILSVKYRERAAFGVKLGGREIVGKIPVIVCPLPPEGLQGFAAAPELAVWLVHAFIGENAGLHNPDHAHLEGARIGCLWTTVENVTKMRRVAATAEKPMPPPTGGKWARARWEAQMVGWFGEIPDFLLTFDANIALASDAASWCATCEHELYHCGQALDEYGSPAFTREGLPKYAILGHDAEEFVGVVRRYGVGASAAGVAELVAAAQQRPEIAAARCEYVCGTCLRPAA